MSHRSLEPKFSWRGVVLIAIAFALCGLAVVFRGSSTPAVTASSTQPVRPPPDLSPVLGSLAFGGLLVVAMLLGAWFGYLRLLRRAQTQQTSAGKADSQEKT